MQEFKTLEIGKEHLEKKGVTAWLTIGVSRRSYMRSLVSSNNVRSMTRGPGAYAKRQVRKKVYGKEMGLTRSLLKSFGLSR